MHAKITITTPITQKIYDVFAKLIYCNIKIWALFNLPSDLSPFVCVCSTVKSESQRQQFLPKTLKLPIIT